MAVLTLTFEADLTSPRFVNHISVYVYLNAGLNTLLSFAVRCQAIGATATGTAGDILCGIKYLRGS
jgi:hypothetical protein